MCNLNIFQVILGGLFVFTYLCLLRQPFYFFPPRNWKWTKWWHFLPLHFSWAISCFEPENLLYLHPFQCNIWNHIDKFCSRTDILCVKLEGFSVWSNDFLYMTFDSGSGWMVSGRWGFTGSHKLSSSILQMNSIMSKWLEDVLLHAGD